jgi:hypothetical protein
MRKHAPVEGFDKPVDESVVNAHGIHFRFRALADCGDMRRPAL